MFEDSAGEFINRDTLGQNFALKAGDLSLNATGNLSLKSSGNLSANAASNLSIKAAADMELTASQLNAKGNSKAAFTSAAATSIGGAILTLNGGGTPVVTVGSPRGSLSVLAP